jgi:hypothetical protein
MKKTTGIKPLLLTFCAVGVLSAMNQSWAAEITNCAEVMAVTEGDVDSLPGGRLDQAVPEDDESCVAVTVVAPVSVGDYIWEDTDKDGNQTAGESALAGATVTLLDKDGNPAKDLAGTAVDPFTTGADGKYLFSNLPEGDYYVAVAPPPGYVATVAVADIDNTPSNTDSNCAVADGKTSRFTLTAGGEPVDDGDTDANSNLSVDCGFYKPTHSIGNRVWIDANNNGLADVGELPVMAGVTLELKDEQGKTITSTTTDAAGRYLFSGLDAGSYQICVASSNFSTGGILQGYTASTGGNVLDANTDIDGDDNGSDDTSTGLCSNLVVLDDKEPLLEATAGGNDGNDGAGTPDKNSNLTVDFGVVAPIVPVSVGNYIWEDTNHDGKQDAGESPLAGAVVTLLDSTGQPAKDLDGNVVAAQTTAADGKYLFSNLPEGEYQVVVVPPAGYTASPDAGDVDDVPANNDSNCAADGKTALFNLTVGGEPVDDGDTDANSNLSVDCGFYKAATPTPVSVGDTIWEDTNKDGIQDATESPLAGAVVTLLDSAGQPAKDLDGNLVAAQTTIADGKYLFNNLPEGDYSISVTPPAGYVFTTQGTTAGANDDSNCMASGVISGITLTAGAESITDGDTDANTDLTEDCGLYKPATPFVSVGNYIWEDTNQDGLQDAGENPLAGATVTLLDNAGQPAKDLTGNVVAAQTTTADGKYLFSNLPEGEYQVVVVPPAGYTASPDAGDVDDVPANNDSNCAADGKTALFNLTVGGEPVDDGDTDANSNLSVDCGFYKPATPTPVSVGDTIWEDTNQDGLQDAGESPLAGAVVTLLDSAGQPAKDLDGNLVAAQTTIADGKYLFSNLPEGDYSISVTPPAGYVFTTQGTTAGANDDSNCTASGVISGITLTAGAESITDGDTDANTDLTEDCGLYKPDTPVHSIGNRVWIDADNSGTADVGEADAGRGVKLILKAEDGSELANTLTDVNGRYLFAGLAEGNYKVCVVASNFAAGGALEGYAASTGAGQHTDPNVGPNGEPDSGIDGDDNGSDDVSQDVCSGLVVLNDKEPLLEATATGDNGNDGLGIPDNRSNLTVDFGFVPPVEQLHSIGNRVWVDANDDGKRDATESPVPDGVVMTLKNTDTGATDQVLTTNGYYLFPLLGAGNYEVCVAPGNFAAGGKLEGYTASTVATVADPNNDVDDDDNGSDVLANGLCTTVALALGSDEPTGETDTARGIPGDDGLLTDDSLSNLTVDFAVVAPVTTPAPTVSVGDTIWEDTNHNGKQDAGEPGIAGVMVDLRNADGTPVIVGGDIALPPVPTDKDGKYLFSNLPEGDYSITVTLPADYQFTAQGTETLANDDSNCAADGKITGINLKAGEESTADGDDDANSDLTQDCGLYKPAVTPTQSIGNRVWIDANNNGVADVGEYPVGAGVTLVLKDADGGELNTTQTDANGRYLFTGLDEGSYQVCVAASNFAAGGKLEGYVGSTGAGEKADANTDIDGDDNGDNDTNKGLCSNLVVLNDKEPLHETTATGDDGNDGTGTPDNHSNLTVDFGVVAPAKTVSVGDKMWIDLDADGKQDPGEPGLEGVTVKLFDKDGNIVATQVSKPDGSYLFTGLPEGQYSIAVIPPALYNIPTLRGGDVDSTPANDDSNCSAGGSTGLFALTAGGEPTDDGDNDSSTNLSVDCGFVPHLQIPTLSQWGMAIMSMLLATAAFFRRRRGD